MRLDIDFTRLAPGQLDAAATWRAPEGQWHREGDVLVLLQGNPRVGEQALDPQAIAERWQRLGVGLAAGLAGDWALAVVDASKRHTVLANDRMAVRSWCHAGSAAALRIADRADTIADGAALRPQALFSYLFNHVIPSPETVFEGVERLPPAHRLLADGKRITVDTHWQPRFAEIDAPDFDGLKEEFRGIVRAAVQREAARWSAGGVGAFLSGGTDSSTVSGMLRQVAGVPVRAYSIGFDADGYDEMEYARIAARHFGLEHREHYLSPEEVMQAMPLVATHYDQPFGNSSAVAAYHCARVAHEDGRAALLAGDGGDELFGGNARYAKQSLFALYENVPAVVRRGLVQPLLNNALVERIPGLSKAASYVQQARVSMPDRLQMYNLLLRLGLADVLAPDFLARVSLEGDREQHRAEYARSAGAAFVNRMLAYDWKYTLADNDLPKVVGTTALVGLSAAFPLLADEVLDFSLRLPAYYKLRGQKLRWFFKEALRGFLPNDIITKKKQGFGLPFGVWALRHEKLAKLADDALSSFATRGVVAPSFVDRLRRELLPSHPGYYGELVWIIAMLEFWLRDRAAQWKLAS